MIKKLIKPNQKTVFDDTGEVSIIFTHVCIALWFMIFFSGCIGQG